MNIERFNTISTLKKYSDQLANFSGSCSLLEMVAANGAPFAGQDLSEITRLIEVKQQCIEKQLLIELENNEKPITDKVRERFFHANQGLLQAENHLAEWVVGTAKQRMPNSLINGLGCVDNDYVYLGFPLTIIVKMADSSVARELTLTGMQCLNVDNPDEVMKPSIIYDRNHQLRYARMLNDGHPWLSENCAIIVVLYEEGLLIIEEIDNAKTIDFRWDVEYNSLLTYQC